MIKISEIQKIPIVFIIGKGRSGTSLLQNIFNANPNTITANESAFIIYLKQKYAGITLWTNTIIDEYIVDLYKDKKISLLWEIKPLILKEVIKSYPLEELNFSIVCKIVYLSAPSPYLKTIPRLIIDKNPLYSFFINELIKIFPDAKFIHLIRDYRDNIISTRKAFEILDISTIAQRWKRQNMLIDRFKEKNKPLFYTIRYEDLVINPQKYLIEICSFTAIEFDLEMLEFYKTTSKIYNNNSVYYNMAVIVQNIHLNLLNPLNSDRIDKWKLELKKREIEIIDYIAGTYAKTYGYNRTTNVMNIWFIITSVKSNLRYYLNYLIYKMYFMLPIIFRDFMHITFKKVRKVLRIKNRHFGMQLKYKNTSKH